MDVLVITIGCEGIPYPSEESNLEGLGDAINRMVASVEAFDEIQVTWKDED